MNNYLSRIEMNLITFSRIVAGNSFRITDSFGSRPTECISEFYLSQILIFSRKFTETNAIENVGKRSNTGLIEISSIFTDRPIQEINRIDAPPAHKICKSYFKSIVKFGCFEWLVIIARIILWILFGSFYFRESMADVWNMRRIIVLERNGAEFYRFI